SRLSPDQQCELLDQVHKDWVKGQVRQFKRSYKKEYRAAAILRGSGFGLALLGWVILFVLLCSGLSAVAHPHFRPWYPPHEILLLSSSLVITGGLFIAYCERRAH